ncbi:MAG: lipid-A-disaccharide synthase [Spirochaetes bacterium GWF1_41_5]|nr:MAG: lipid-A-disaccharide synthase [Spirochaetes bacterium GWF1_41_5]HBE02601.1 lipid-A-disaccharide synthase [Spirochaetia bacterium]
MPRPNNPLHIFISTGEISGDYHGARLIEALKKNSPAPLRISGLGGKQMAGTGAEISGDITMYSSVGLSEGLRFFFSGKKNRSLSRAVKFILKEKPDLVVCVDNQGTNISLGALAHSRGLKTAYYFPPPVYIWGRWNIEKLKKHFDLVLCQFEKDYELYRAGGVNCLFTGHPFGSEDFSDHKISLRRQAGIPENAEVTGIFPGSRLQEIENLTPVFLETCKKLHKKNPDMLFYLSLAHEGFYNKVRKYAEKIFPLVDIACGRHREIMQIADFLLICSGTATLEGAFYRKPMAIGYRISALSAFIARRLVKVNHIGIANILAGKTISPEFINKDCTPENLAEYAALVFGSENLRRETAGQYERLINSIGRGDPLKTAGAALLNLACR